jgi:ribosomal protein L37E/DNA-directed RNA polymerase subunit RPC12/RpoP
MTDNEKKYTNDPAYKHIKNPSSKYKNTNWKENLNPEEKKFYNSNPLPFLASKAENYSLFLKRYEKSKIDPNWKEKLNPEEKKFYNSNPLPFLESKAENYSLFLKRYEKSKKEPSVPIPRSQKMEASFNENLTNKKTCPECGSSVNQDENFCGECGFNLENLASKNNDIEVNKEKVSSTEENTSLVTVENKKVDKLSKIKTKKTPLICSECGFPLNEREDVFCPECGCKIIYPGNELDEKDNIDQNLDKEESVISNEETQEAPISHNDLPIDILVDLKSFFEDKLINEDEYNHLRKSALKISKNSESMDGLEKIRSISREKLTELRSLFNERLIDQDEYDDLRKNLIEIE